MSKHKSKNKKVRSISLPIPTRELSNLTMEIEYDMEIEFSNDHKSKDDNNGHSSNNIYEDNDYSSFEDLSHVEQIEEYTNQLPYYEEDPLNNVFMNSGSTFTNVTEHMEEYTEQLPYYEEDSKNNVFVNSGNTFTNVTEQLEQTEQHTEQFSDYEEDPLNNVFVNSGSTFAYVPEHMEHSEDSTSIFSSISSTRNNENLNNALLRVTKTVPNVMDQSERNTIDEVDTNKSSIIKVTYPNNDLKNNKKQPKSSSYQIKQELLENLIVVKKDDILYYWDKYYHQINELNYDEIIRQNIPLKYFHTTNSFTCNEIYKWLKCDKSLIKTDESFKDKKNYVAFKDCIVEIQSGKIIALNPEYFFTSFINANITNIETDGYHFEKFMAQITKGNTALYKRIQELFGYVISEYRELKVMPFFIGPKDCGKSVVLNILEYLIGHNNVSNLSMNDFNSKLMLGELFNKKLNTCGETSEIVLNKLDTLKMATGQDIIYANPKYVKPIKFYNQAVLVFSGNHLPVLNKTKESNAFRKRLLLFPFHNVVPKENQDPLLIEKIKAEVDYIALWALEGARRLINNNFRFTSFDIIDELLSDYLVDDRDSVQEFITEKCIINKQSRCYSEALLTAYKEFCYDNNLTPVSPKMFHHYLQYNMMLEHKKYRDKKDNKNGYLGIELN